MYILALVSIHCIKKLDSTRIALKFPWKLVMILYIISTKIIIYLLNKILEMKGINEFLIYLKCSIYDKYS